MNRRMRSSGRRWPGRLLWVLATVAGLLLGTAGPAAADGISIGPYGGSVHALAIDPRTPTTLYAGAAYAGVVKSTDGGGSWRAVNTGLVGCGGGNCDVRALALDPTTPTTLYAGTTLRRLQEHGRGRELERGEHGAVAAPPVSAPSPSTPRPRPPSTRGRRSGVFKSTDGGGSWNAVNTGLTSLTSLLDVRALALDPTTPTTLYAGTSFPFGGVFKTTNGGGSWSPVNTGLTTTNVRALALDPTTPTTLYAGTDDGVFKTTDGGGSWSAVNTGLAECRHYSGPRPRPPDPDHPLRGDGWASSRPRTGARAGAR